LHDSHDPIDVVDLFADQLRAPGSLASGGRP
jgi:hypothetical protein